MAAAVPFAIKAGSALAGSFLGKKLSGPSKQQKSATEGLERSAGNIESAAYPLMQQGSKLAGQGAGYLKQAGDYYGNILNSRAGAREAMAPEIANALEFYRGAEKKTGRELRGGSRDYALAELDRQKVGQIANFLPAARANAAQGAGQIGATGVYGGGQMTGQGTSALGTAGYLRSGLFNQATQLREQEAEGGRNWGSFIYDILGSTGLGKKKGAGGSSALGGLYGAVPFPITGSR